MRRITAAVFAALLTASLAGLAGTAVAAPTTVTGNQCMLGGGEVRVISPSLKVCVGGIFDGQRVVG
ncbi:MULTISPECIES: hypothetical protein [Streptomyces]|uniref:hypothetical protein n=1 Tax=Streptomyces TaxID=1883 RepID=UPI00163B7116|nr:MULTISPECIES: hypothetical protein [Streptomyces]MBC2877250.1 hypothetical protein [Streptomyces sp. TYQ1024]UBI39516.1 hypothetical protein K7I03_25620 [Streptomyces mobaraensis]UKW32095.1 hypothetical protein MCU78_25555 [Streptomyces sp. TYQ1024]